MSDEQSGFMLPAVPLEPLRSRDPQQLGGYRLLGRLGHGGMGVAFLSQSGNDWVVVKMIRSDLTDDTSFRSRIGRELEAMKRAEGRHTASLLESDLHDDPAWFAMEFIPGLTLQRRVKEQGALQGPEVTALAIALAEVMQYVHSRGIVHRDLKPGNIMLSPTGPRLIDFGIADLSDGTQLTSTGTVLGSTGWLAPEQVTGDQVSSATDVHAWALCILYAATGEPSFGNESASISMYRVLEVTPDVPTTISQPLRSLLEAGVKKEPVRRPTVDRILAELSPPMPESPQRTPISGTRILTKGADASPPRNEEPDSPSAIPAQKPSGNAPPITTPASAHAAMQQKEQDLARAQVTIEPERPPVTPQASPNPTAPTISSPLAPPGPPKSAVATLSPTPAGGNGNRSKLLLVGVPAALLAVAAIGFVGVKASARSADSSSGPAASSSVASASPTETSRDTPASIGTPSPSPTLTYDVKVNYGMNSIPDMTYDNTLDWKVDICSDDTSFLIQANLDKTSLAKKVGSTWVQQKVTPRADTGGRCGDKKVNLTIPVSEPTPAASTINAGWGPCTDYRVTLPETKNYAKTTLDICVSTNAVSP